MKKTIFIIFAVFALIVLPVCAQDTLTAEWTRQGYFTDESGNFLSVYYSDMEGYEGWVVGCILGEEMYGDLVEQVGDTLHGDIVPEYEEGEFIVTVCEEGEEGLLLLTESGDTYHFIPMEMEEATISVSVNTEGMGSYLIADGESTEWNDDGFPFSSSVFNLNAPETHTFLARPWEGCNFIKWTKDGQDYSFDPLITIEMNESADYIAVFDWGLPSEEEGINYLALVNKVNPLPEDWEEKLKTVHMTNSLGDDVEVEQIAYEAYLRLRQDLAEEGIFVDLDSARRSVAEQQEIMDRFTVEYGADYASKIVAVPGYSEHHTGLALDLYLNIDGQDVYYNEDMVRYPEIWAKIHEKLADYGFILRYLEGKEHITGYAYEPWHIRYIADPDAARYIMDNGITFEGYLGAASEFVPVIDYGTSEIYTLAELEEAAVQIKCKFASWTGLGCELHNLRYAGDEACTEENVAWLNSHEEGANFVQAAEFLSDYHSPQEGQYAWEPDHEYTDYQWWLGRTEDGGWEVVDWGY